MHTAMQQAIRIIRCSASKRHPRQSQRGPRRQWGDMGTDEAGCADPARGADDGDWFLQPRRREQNKPMPSRQDVHEALTAIDVSDQVRCGETASARGVGG